MKMAKIVIVGIAFLSFIIAIYFYPMLPEKIASHWNAGGKVDGYVPKIWILSFPLLIVITSLALFTIPKVDPLKRNIERFRKYYDRFIIIIAMFLFWIYLFVILWNLGIKVNTPIAIIPACAILFYYFGILCENAKRNWFIGIRTPWTLSNERVWNRTHKMCGKLFKVASVISLIGMVFQSYAIFFVLIPVILVAIYAIIYSYFEYQKLSRASNI
ncbi:MAG: hypothetical protein DRP03_00325 [Candidatus Aenigmatarchaeota archaeon]|nr:MAG: hypothetical protein DRP03_00325 [Candidatus Aenigmarchaeota archaeon]